MIFFVYEKNYVYIWFFRMCTWFFSYLHMIFFVNGTIRHQVIDITPGFPGTWFSSSTCCLGPFHVNNCLWKYAVTPNARTAMVSNDKRATQVWSQQRTVFGSSYREQHDYWMREKHVYFRLITSDSIEDTIHTFRSGTTEPDHCHWIQTVYLF